MSAEFVYGENVAAYYPNVSIRIERITPAIAEKMLEHNTHNRDPKRESIVRAIESGEWFLNGATIVFSSDGVLLDGQNRLMACTRSGIPIDTIVVRGLALNAQLTMDTGVRRSLQDYAKMKGYPSYKRVSTIATALCRIDRTGDIETAFFRMNGNELTLKELCNFLDANYEKRILPILPRVTRVTNRFTGLPTMVLSALFERFMAAGEDDLDGFINQLCGIGRRCDAAALLEKRLSDNEKSKKGKLPIRTIAAYFVKAWNSYMMGTPMDRLTFKPGGDKPEKFPTIYLGDDAV